MTTGICSNRSSFSTERKCKICYHSYHSENQPQFSSAYAQKLLNCCTKHLFSELIDGEFQLNFNSNEYLPFCSNCSQSVQQISIWNDQLESIQREISDYVDRFTLKVLKCRKDLKNHGISQCDTSTLCDTSSSGSLLQIVDVTSNIFEHQTISFQCNEQVPTNDDCIELKYIPPIISSRSEPIFQDSINSTSSAEEGIHLCSPVSNQSSSRPSVSGIQKLEIKLERLEFDDGGNLISKSSNASEAWPKNKIRIPTHPIPVIDLESDTGPSPTASNGNAKIRGRPPKEGKVDKIKKTKPTAQARTRRRKFKCTTCIRSFSYKLSWQKHKVECFGPEIHSCTVCELTFATKTQLDDHSLTHTNTEDLNVNVSLPLVFAYDHLRCKICNKKYTSEKYLRRHVGIHEAERPYKCNICSSSFVGKNHLTMHLKKHNNDLKKNLLKSNVSKKYVKAKAIKVGTLTAKNGIHKFRCRFCRKLFQSKTKLITHLQTHTEDSVYRCSTCDRVCASKTSLKTHQIVHTGEKKMKCAVCNEAFKYSSQLKRHSVIHTVDSSSINISNNYASVAESQVDEEVNVDDGDLENDGDVGNVEDEVGFGNEDDDVGNFDYEDVVGNVDDEDGVGNVDDEDGVGNADDQGVISIGVNGIINSVSEY